MNRVDALAELTRLVSPTTAPTLTQDDLDRALDAARLADPDGRPPTAVGWVETYDPEYAAAETFEYRATRALLGDTGGIESFSADGAQFVRRRGSGYAEFMALAAHYRARSTAAGTGFSVITLEAEDAHRPRSARPHLVPSERWDLE